jgi:hypothetical protein
VPPLADIFVLGRCPTCLKQNNKKNQIPSYLVQHLYYKFKLESVQILNK